MSDGGRIEYIAILLNHSTTPWARIASGVQALAGDPLKACIALGIGCADCKE
jgi:hypothetical protein